jgi:hypothetical protein
MNRSSYHFLTKTAPCVPVIAVMAMLGLAAGISSANAQSDDSTVVADAIADTVNNSNAAEFRLFESIDSADSPSAARNRRNSRSAVAARNAASSPEFTLVGTSRIGDKYSVILAHRGGDSVVVSAAAGATTRISGYSQYSIANIGTGRVSVNFPDSSPCAEFEDLGVRCDSATNIAELTITNVAPLAPSQRQQAQQREQSEDAAAGETAPDEAPPNPFAALSAAAAENSAGNANASRAGGRNGADRFTPRRISPEDVPPGMRVVSTPFGDRLVDQ